MKIVRYADEQGRVGHACWANDGSYKRLVGDIYGDYSTTDEVVRVCKILSPVAPTAILCIGLNYRKHAEESNMPIPEHPIVFMKMPSAVIGPGDAIQIPRHLASHKVDYECELAVVIGKACKNATPQNALEYVLGYTCGNDVSARDWQSEWGGGQWCKGKGFDTFAPLGPCLVTTDEIEDPNALAIRTILNNKVVQNSNTVDMVFDVKMLISFLSGSTTLAPGTVIFTGTPSGIGMARKPPLLLGAGDSVTIEIESIGQLTNTVIEELA